MIRRGNLSVFVSYTPDGDGYTENGMDSKEPCLFIATGMGGSQSHRRAWGIPLSAASKYCNSDGYPTTYCFQQLTRIAEYLGLGTDLWQRRAIWQAIGDYLPDLIHAKEFEMVEKERHPDGVLPARGDVKIVLDGKVVGEQVVH